MELGGNKCVMVLDEALPLGVIANTAGIMGLTLGKHIPETIGPKVLDKSGCVHLGIIQIPVPVLKADRGKIKEIRQPALTEISIRQILSIFSKSIILERLFLLKILKHLLTNYQLYITIMIVIKCEWQLPFALAILGNMNRFVYLMI